MIEKLKNKFVNFCKWVWSECKDWHTLVLFLVVVFVMYTPVWGGYLLHLIFKIKWGSVVATTYLAFWAGPFTPYFPLCIAITLGLKKIIDRVKHKKEISEDFMNKDYIIRPERKEDYREVENLVRESFWNVYRPGCLEHYVLNQLRDDKDFVPELDYVMEKDGRIIGQNIFVRATIKADDGRDIPVMAMGPICITPELKRQGYGKAILDYTLEKAKELGCGAVCFEGNIDFYGKSGFTYAEKYGIRYHGLPEGEDASFFLCKELIDGYLDGVTGEYATPQGYFVDEAEADEFDKQFPPKEKLKLPGQLF